MEVNGIGSGYIYGAVPPKVREAVQESAGRAAHGVAEAARDTAHLLTHPDEWGARLRQGAASIIKFVEEHPESLLM